VATALRSQHLGDRDLEVVVTDLPGRYPAEHPERVLVAFEEGFLPAREEDLSPR
jgi:hypothetical protein